MHADVNFSERLAFAIREDGRTKAAIARAIGAQAPAISRWLAGSIPDLRRATDIARELNVSVQWLLTGSGEMRQAEGLTGMVREDAAEYRAHIHPETQRVYQDMERQALQPFSKHTLDEIWQWLAEESNRQPGKNAAEQAGALRLAEDAIKELKRRLKA